MSAPNTAYHNNGNAVISLHKVAVSKADCYPALNIYGAADLKALFYLDGFLIFPQKQPDGTIIESFLGYVLEGGANAAMHNISRYSKTRVPVKMPDGSVKMVIVLNDAGLNTLGRGDVPTVSDRNIANLKVGSLFKSAYWIDSGNYGIIWRSGSISNREERAGTYFAQNTVKSGEVHIVDLNIRAGDTVFAKAFLTNEEGTYYSTEMNFAIKPQAILVRFHNAYASSAYYGGESKTIYIGTYSAMVGTNIYDTETMQLGLLQQGYYIIGEQWYEVRPRTENSESVLKVIAMGDCTPTGWPAGDPARDTGVRTAQEAYYNASSYVNPCQSYNDGNIPNRTIWLRAFDGKYYATETGPDFCANGWYVWNGQYRQITNGIATAPTSCPTGN